MYAYMAAVAMIILSAAVTIMQPAAATSWPADHAAAAAVSPLQLDFYEQSCTNLHSIVSERVAHYTAQNPTTPASLLRLFFHDCFVQGCDASALLNTTSSSAEKDSDNNFSLAGFEIINDIKSCLESHCPGVVSCADILALAAAYSVRQAGGPMYELELGRRDGLTSYATSASIFLPDATVHVDGLVQNFEIVGLDELDLVALSGAHTVGQAHCRSIADRLYPRVDSAYHKGYGEKLLRECTDNGRLAAPKFDPNVHFFNDALTALKFDNAYFKGLQRGYGLFTSDKSLYADRRTRPLVDFFARNQSAFFAQFGVSLRKMGRIGVLTGTQGQIRSQCWIRNSHNADPALNPPTHDHG